MWSIAWLYCVRHQIKQMYEKPLSLCMFAVYCIDFDLWRKRKKPYSSIFFPPILLPIGVIRLGRYRSDLTDERHCGRALNRNFYSHGTCLWKFNSPDFPKTYWLVVPLKQNSLVWINHHCVVYSLGYSFVSAFFCFSWITQKILTVKDT